MSLEHARRMLQRSVSDRASRVEFARARQRQPALAAFPTPSWALSWLADSSQTRVLEKESLIRAFIAELQRDLHPLWSSLSLLACYPMLGRLRSRVRGDAVKNGELDQLVMAIFLEVIAAFPLDGIPDRTFLRLRQMCQRRLFRHIRKEQRYRETVHVVEVWQLRLHEQHCIDQDRPHRWPETRPHVRERDPAETRDQVEFLTAHAEQLLGGDRLDLVIATLVHGERLRQYVAREHPDLGPDEHERAYQRVKRRHSRAVARLREHLAHLRPAPAAHAIDAQAERSR